MTDTTRDLLISLSAHMAYMQGQLEARHELDDPEDFYWYRESVLLRQKVTDALADEPAVPEGREPAAVTGQPSDEELESFLVDVAANHGDIYWAEPLVLARAVLARWGNPVPAPPVDGEVNDLSHLSDAEFNALCPHDGHAPGPEPLSPAAQAVMIAATNGNINVVNDPVYKQCIAAALRAAANSCDADWLALTAIHHLHAIATELENHQ